MKQIRKRLTYANVMSSIAVFLILGGATAFAAVKKIGANEIKANSIKTGKIVKEAVTAGKIKNGAVTETKIADGAVTNKKIADNAVTTAKIANDAVTGDKVKESTLGQVPDAKTLEGVGVSAFSRQASSGIDDNALSGPVTTTTAREVNITAPQSGFLLMIASSDVFNFTGSNTPTCELTADGSSLANTRRTIELGTGNTEENCGTNGVVAVGAGLHNIKFTFVGRATATTVDETELNVVFIPFAG